MGACSSAAGSGGRSAGRILAGLAARAAPPRHAITISQPTRGIRPSGLDCQETMTRDPPRGFPRIALIPGVEVPGAGVDFGRGRSSVRRTGRESLDDGGFADAIPAADLLERDRTGRSCPKEEEAKILGEYGAFTESIAKSGHYKAGEALEPTSTATTVRVRDGKTTTTDGPFAETREQLGGFYLIEAKDLDEAAAIAARVPGARDGSIEVRPIMPTH